MHNLNEMVIFAKVVQSGGFTAAAKALGLPKSNVSRHVSKLENELNVQLLERSTRKIHLTQIGEVYYRHAQRIIEEAENAELSVSNMMQGPRGLLRVSTSVTSGQQLLSPILSDFLLRYPEIQFQLELSNRRIDLIEEGFDLALRVGSLVESRLIARYLGRCRLLLYANDRYIERMGEPKSPQDLLNHKLMYMDEGGRKDSLTLLGSLAEEKISTNPSISVNDFQTLHRLACDGVGIAILPHYMCMENLNGKNLIRVLPDWELMSEEIHAIYPSRRGVTPKLRVFLDYVIEKLADRLENDRK